MSQDAYRYELEKNHRWNSVMNILDGVFFQIGFAGLIPAVIIVAYLKHYTDNEMILNLPVFIANFSFAMGPFLMSFFSPRVKRKKRAVVFSGFLQRILLLPLIFVVYFLSDSKSLVIPIFLAVFTIFYMVWGSGSLFWQELMGRALAPNQFTSAMAAREVIGRVMGFLSSLAVTVILSRYAFPNNFLIVLSMCFVMWFLSLYWLGIMKEAPYEEEIREENPIRHLKNLGQLPLKNRFFLWYMVFILFYYGYLFVGGLYTVAGIERFSAVAGQDRLTGIIGIMTVLSSSVSAFLVSRIVKKVGKAWGFAFFAIINMVLPLGMIFCRNYYLYLFLIFLSGIINASWFLEMTMLMGFSVPEKRHEYIAFNSLVKLIPIVLYTNLGGYLANTFSQSVTFVVAASFCLIALFILVFKLRFFFKSSDMEEYQ